MEIKKNTWNILYSNGFSYDPENNWWYKYPLNYNEDSLLEGLGFTETSESIEKREKKKKIQSIYTNGKKVNQLK